MTESLLEKKIFCCHGEGNKYLKSVKLFTFFFFCSQLNIFFDVNEQEKKILFVTFPLPTHAVFNRPKLAS
jgi:hypothetical protein